MDTSEVWENEKEHSDFNSALATIIRIDEIKKHITVATVKKNYEMHFLLLKAYWKELHPMLSREKKGKDKETERSKQKANYLRCREVYNKITQKKEVSQAEYDLLDDWELELRELEQAHKLNMPMGRDSRWAMKS